VKSVPKLERGQYVMVKWIDSAGSDGGWRHQKRKHCVPSEIVTVGQVFVWRKTDLTVVMSESSTGSKDGCITIPACCITDILKLKGHHGN